MPWRRKLSKHPEKFGTGSNHQGVAAPESGKQRQAAGGSMVPLLALGIPLVRDECRAVWSGRSMVHGLKPGPLLFQTSPEFVWGLIASMYIANRSCCLILNPAVWVGFWASLLRVPYKILYAHHR